VVGRRMEEGAVSRAFARANARDARGSTRYMCVCVRVFVCMRVRVLKCNVAMSCPQVRVRVRSERRKEEKRKEKKKKKKNIYIYMYIYICIFMHKWRKGRARDCAILRHTHRHVLFYANHADIPSTFSLASRESLIYIYIYI